MNDSWRKNRSPYRIDRHKSKEKERATPLARRSARTKFEVVNYLDDGRFAIQFGLVARVTDFDRHPAHLVWIGDAQPNSCPVILNDARH